MRRTLRDLLDERLRENADLDLEIRSVEEKLDALTKYRAQLLARKAIVVDDLAAMRAATKGVEDESAEPQAIEAGSPIVERTAEEPRPTAWDHIREGVLDDDTPSTALQEVAEAIAKLGGKATNEQVAKALKITSGAASIRLSRAAREGVVLRLRQGVYAVPPPRQEKKIM